jgi:DNA-binding transcriptional regulator YdaS (Cro superfamily)
LRYAEAIAGGVESLASRLQVSSSLLQAWAEGWEEIPDSIYLSVIDVICEASSDDLKRARNYHPSLPDEQ